VEQPDCLQPQINAFGSGFLASRGSGGKLGFITRFNGLSQRVLHEEETNNSKIAIRLVLDS
jgi:hypothetical protein